MNDRKRKPARGCGLQVIMDAVARAMTVLGIPRVDAPTGRLDDGSGTEQA